MSKTNDSYFERKDDTSTVPRSTVLDQLEDIQYMLRAGKIKHAELLVESAILSQKSS